MAKAAMPLELTDESYYENSMNKLTPKLCLHHTINCLFFINGATNYSHRLNHSAIGQVHPLRY